MVLEPLVEKVTVEAPLSAKLSKVCHSSGVSIPASAGLQRSFVYVRQDDIIDFPDQGIKITVMITVEGSPSPSSGGSFLGQNGQDVSKDEVQVKSSIIEAHVADGAKPDHKTDSGDEAEGGSTTRSAKTPAAASDVTPATSNPTVEPTIGETPIKPASTHNEEEAWFSTAPNAAANAAEPTDDDEQPDEIDSPTAVRSKKVFQTKRSTAEDSQAQASVNLMSTVDGLPGSDSSDELETFTSVNGKVTYGKQRGRSSNRHQPPKRPTATPGTTSAEDDSSPGAGAIVASKERDMINMTAEGEEGENDPIIAPTSDNPDESGVTWEAATRSVKRKNTDDEEEEVDTDASTRKKRRTTASTGASEDTDDEDGDQHEATKSTAKAKKGRLPEVARWETEESADEIAVVKRTVPPKGSGPKKKKSSPQVMVPRPRASTTPSSSAASTTLAGKVPKVLLSKDSPLRKSTGKWLKAQGAQVIDDVQSRRSNFVCVPNSGKLKTAKVLRSLALGKLVVTEDWVTDSKKAGELLDPQGYVPEDLKQTINVDRRNIFTGMNLFFTNALVDKVYTDGWEEVQALAKDAGASHVDKGSWTTGVKSSGRNGVVYFGKDTDDADAIRLMKDHGCTVYRKELLTDSILTGELDLDEDEFKLVVGSTKKKGRQ